MGHVSSPSEEPSSRPRVMTKSVPPGATHIAAAYRPSPEMCGKYLQSIDFSDKVILFTPSGREIEEVAYLIVHDGIGKPNPTRVDCRRGDVKSRHDTARSRKVFGVITETAADGQAPSACEIVTSLAVPTDQVGVWHSIGPRNALVAISSRLVQGLKPAEMITPTGMLLLQAPNGAAVSRQRRASMSRTAGRYPSVLDRWTLTRPTEFGAVGAGSVAMPLMLDPDSYSVPRGVNRQPATGARRTAERLVGATGFR